MSAFARTSTPLPYAYELGGGGEDRARIVCAFMGCDERPYNPPLSALPRVIHLSTADPRAATGWLGTLLGIVAQESGRQQAGGENVLSRLAERSATNRKPRSAVRSRSSWARRQRPGGREPR